MNIHASGPALDLDATGADYTDASPLGPTLAGYPRLLFRARPGERFRVAATFTASLEGASDTLDMRLVLMDVGNGSPELPRAIGAAGVRFVATSELEKPVMVTCEGEFDILAVDHRTGVFELWPEWRSQNACALRVSYWADGKGYADYSLQSA